MNGVDLPIKRLYRGLHTEYPWEWLEGVPVPLQDGKWAIIDKPVTEVKDFEELTVSYNTITRFTGLYDIDGTKIYEDDIIDFVKNGELCETPCRIKWHPFLTLFYLSFSWDENPKRDDTKNSIGGMLQTYQAKVLGNIYDNPDLLPKNSPYMIVKNRR